MFTSHIVWHATTTGKRTTTKKSTGKKILALKWFIFFLIWFRQVQNISWISNCFHCLFIRIKRKIKLIFRSNLCYEIICVVLNDWYWWWRPESLKTKIKHFNYEQESLLVIKLMKLNEYLKPNLLPRIISFKSVKKNI